MYSQSLYYFNTVFLITFFAVFLIIGRCLFTDFSSERGSQEWVVRGHQWRRPQPYQSRITMVATADQNSRQMTSTVSQIWRYIHFMFNLYLRR